MELHQCSTCGMYGIHACPGAKPIKWSNTAYPPVIGRTEVITPTRTVCRYKRPWATLGITYMRDGWYRLTNRKGEPAGMIRFSGARKPRIIVREELCNLTPLQSPKQGS